MLEHVFLDARGMKRKTEYYLNLLIHNIDNNTNNPFYSCVLGDLASEWK